MKEIVFGRWGNVVLDLRNVESEASGEAPVEGFPSASEFPEDLAALMSGKGMLLLNSEFNYFNMIRQYVTLIQERYCCGKCLTGIKGTKMLQLILDRVAGGDGTDSDLDMLARVGDILDEATRCSICQSAGELVKDGLAHFRDHFVAAVKSGAEADGMRYFGQISAPCMNACPCHIHIPAYVEKLQEVRYAESLNIIRQRMPLPGITGRICPAPCQKACTLAGQGLPSIPIMSLKRVAADYEMTHKTPPPMERKDLEGAPVAVIGAGPAGLAAAYYLNRLGHAVTLFEALEVSGGMVGVGVPPYRQPRDVLTRDIEIIRDLGVELKLNSKLGTDYTIQDLFDQGFKAVFLGIGSHKSIALGLKGEDQNYKGVYSGGIDFLRDLNLDEDVTIGDKVIVVGGGNTAIDCARTCLRLGASEVRIVYRRTEKEMPAEAHEVADAQEEGVILNTLTQPIEIVAEEGKLVSLTCIKMELGEPDRSGRRRPVPVEGSEFSIEADTLIPAIGQTADLSMFTPEDGIKIGRWSNIEVDKYTMMTPRPGVFAAGDAVTGPLTVVHGVAGGRQAAWKIHRYITTGSCEVSDEQIMEEIVSAIEKDQQTFVTPRTESRKGSTLPPKRLDMRERITSFEEVDSGFSQEGSYVEASRCLRCYHLVFAAFSEPKTG